jgi:hypothetical protein
MSKGNRMKCTEANRADWEPSYNEGVDDGYAENCPKAGAEKADYPDAYEAGYKQGHHDKYNPE